MNVVYSVLQSVTDAHPARCEVSWEELAQRLTAHAVVARKTDVGLYAAASFRDESSRSVANGEKVTMLVLDVDNKKIDGTRVDSPIDPQVIEALLEGHAFAIASSFRSTPDWPRFRVNIPLAMAIPVESWPLVAPLLLERLQLDGFRENIDELYARPAQIYYWPACSDLSLAYSSIGEGTFLAPPAEIPTPRTRAKLPEGRFTEPQIDSYYRTRLPDLDRNRGREWRMHCPIHHGKKRDDSFSVNPHNGLWVCHADCGRGGDIYALEMALMECDFRTARDVVDDMLGVDTGILPGAENFVRLGAELQQITAPDQITPALIERIARQDTQPRHDLMQQLIAQTQIAPDMLEQQVKQAREEVKNQAVSFPGENVTASRGVPDEVDDEDVRPAGDPEQWGLCMPGDRYVLDPKGRGIYPIKILPKKGAVTQWLNPTCERIIWPKTLADDLSTGKTYMHLHWLGSDGRTHAEWMLDAESNSRETLLGLTDAPVSLGSVSAVSAWLAYAKSYVVAPRIPATSRLGWIKDRFVLDAASESLFFIGTDLPRGGSVDGWLAGLDLLLATSSGEYIPWAVLGLSVISPLVRFFRHRNPVLGLIAESSQGKGSIINYALSMWTDPARLTIPAGSTTKGVQDHANGLSDIPIFIDEMQQLLKRDVRELENMIYYSANGQRRVTSSRAQVAKGGEQHHGVRFFAAEQRVMSTAQKGAQYRTIEAEGSPLPNQAVADQLQAITRAHYGQIGLLLAAILNDQKDSLIETVLTMVPEFQALYPGLIGDDALVIAQVHAGLQVLSWVYQKPLPIDEVVHLFAHTLNDQRMATVDMPQRVWTLMLDTVQSGDWCNDRLDEESYTVAYRGIELVTSNDSVLELNPAAPTLARFLAQQHFTEDMARVWAHRGWIIPTVTDNTRWRRPTGKSGAGCRTWRVTQKGLDVVDCH